MLTSRGRVLVVDDARINRRLLMTHVGEAGHLVECAADGREAIDMLRMGGFDVVLLDLMMPNMTGYDVLAELQKDETLRHIPVIVVSSVEETESVVRCLEMGATDYVSKPFNPVLVKARLNASLLRKRMRDAEESHFAELEREKARADQVLYNILPRPIAERLKRGDREIVEYFPSATVLFADLVGFTSFSAEHTPAEVLLTLNTIFSGFDALLERHAGEKIKTIGDEYMVVGGVPVANPDHAAATTRLGLEMLREIERINPKLPSPMSLRIGIHSGPVLAGVLGSHKFAFDLWGDTVNTAHRVQAAGSPGHVVVTANTRRLLGDEFTAAPRGRTELRGRAALDTFVVTAP